MHCASFEIVHAQFANFWPEPDPNPNPNPYADLNPNPNLNSSQIVQHLLQIVQTHKLCTNILFVIISNWPLKLKLK